MTPAAEARLRAAIRKAEQILDADLPGNEVSLFASEIGASFTFTCGTNVLRHCGVTVTSTCGGPMMLKAWLGKARVKLEAAVKP